LGSVGGNRIVSGKVDGLLLVFFLLFLLITALVVGGRCCVLTVATSRVFLKIITFALKLVVRGRRCWCGWGRNGCVHLGRKDEHLGKEGKERKERKGRLGME
jgi:membrane protein implicated in regulation of membrane protease activity